jgi:flagellar basal-body rod protein FlgB
MHFTTQLSDELNRYMDLASTQLKITSSNVANVDTPGYHTKGIDFYSEMKRSLNEINNGGTGSDHPLDVVKVDGLLERPDGNNVSMDREGLSMAEAQLEFHVGEELIKDNYKGELDAIKDTSN